MSFLNSAKGRLFIIFDEAHHSPAPSFRKLMLQLREKYPEFFLLGLTATPTYTDDEKRGWLHEIFPQGIIHQEIAKDLMMANILAKPIPLTAETRFVPNFDERDYHLWVGSGRDILEDIISQLAGNHERNDFIISSYLLDKEKYGKTIIFADRIAQCIYLVGKLKEQGIKADYVFTEYGGKYIAFGDRDKPSPENNLEVIEKFKNDELDVLVNVRMLTEGTDVPNVQTVFLTRQTTSQILLTQMVGRALRGPRCGGTKEAYIVSFIDDWQQLINWAQYDELQAMEIEEDAEYKATPPFQLISINLVKQLVEQMVLGITSPLPFLQHLPKGWFIATYQYSSSESDETDMRTEKVLVFDEEYEAFNSFLDYQIASDLARFEEISISKVDSADQLSQWQEKFFLKPECHLGCDLQSDIFSLTLHLAQHDKRKPEFFAFDARDLHNIDAIAQIIIDQDMRQSEEESYLRAEFTKTDLFWKVLFISYENFKSQVDLSKRKLSANNDDYGDVTGVIETSFEVIPDPPAGLREQVLQNDGYKCLCCGYDNTKYLQIDHIIPWHIAPSWDPDNLQTLCKWCNNDKRIRTINFRNYCADSKPSGIIDFKGSINDASSIIEWERFLRRTINFYYRCGAVSNVYIHQRRSGEFYYRWMIELNGGKNSNGLCNDPKYLKPHLDDLLKHIRYLREDLSLDTPRTLVIRAPGFDEIESREYTALI